jgi:hypothetical membrane protein
MTSKPELLNLLRKTQTITSIVIFFIVLFFCWSVNSFNIEEIQISYWGGSDLEYGWLWNGVIILLSISVFFNNISFIKNHNRIKKKLIPYILFSFVAICLFFIGVFNLEKGLLHNIPAYFYFFTYPLTIFITAFLNRGDLLYKEWYFHLMASIVMIIIPLLFINFFSGLAIPEITHSIIVSVWNIIITFKKV